MKHNILNEDLREENGKVIQKKMYKKEKSI